MISEIYQTIVYFFNLSVSDDVLWIVLPLAIATIAILIYFQKYRDERPGWNTYFANSLVLLFVAIILLRQIHSIGNLGTINYINYPAKTIVSVSLLLIGVIILFFNFKHFLPEKIAMHISSPLTLNLIAYIAIIFVYSSLEDGRWIFFSLLIIFILLITLLNIIKKLMERFFSHLKKMKEQEKKELIIHEKKQIEKKKEELKKEEKVIRKEKKEVKKVEKEVKKGELKKLDKQEKEAIKLKKIVKRPLKGVRK